MLYRRIRLCAAAACAALAISLVPHAGASGTVEVIVDNYKYQPAELKVKVGTTVRWVNREKRTSHSVIWLGPDGGYESDRFFPDESYERKFDKPGTFPYTCGPHPEMKGVVIVTP
ncbi:MAG: plastocyanin [Gammaproteobacteria bacterium]|nr:plastocyanin [Gammaproteobacteria bacterium]